MPNNINYVRDTAERDEVWYLDAIRANPAEHRNWLNLTQWLQERGDPRAELLLLQLELLVVDVPERESKERQMHRLLESVDPIKVKVTNSIGMDLVLVRPGEFLMGSPAGEQGRSIDEHQHLVEITEPFYIGVFEVTRRQYYEALGSSAGNERPVHSQSWGEAVKFCRNLSEKEGLTYSLPSEAQWEYACRAGTSTPLSFGLSIETKSHPSAQQDEIATKAQRSGLASAVVGAYGANPWGIYDMHGNVWEWCADWYDESYYKRSPVRDPSGPNTGYERAVRGGSRRGGDAFTRSAHRNCFSPTGKTAAIGFRVCRRCS